MFWRQPISDLSATPKMLLVSFGRWKWQHSAVSLVSTLFSLSFCPPFFPVFNICSSCLFFSSLFSSLYFCLYPSFLIFVLLCSFFYFLTFFLFVNFSGLRPIVQKQKLLRATNGEEVVKSRDLSVGRRHKRR